MSIQNTFSLTNPDKDMKIPALFGLICLVSSFPLGAQSILLQDDFGSYAPGILAPSANWPSSIPGTVPSRAWQTNAYNRGPQQILANAGGRSGNVFSYSENTAGTTASATYSSVELSSAYSGTDDWVLSLDFYVESMPVGVASGTFGLVTIANGDPANYASTGISSVSLLRTNSNTNLNVFYGSGGGGGQFNVYLSLDTWYTLTITGNNMTQALSVNIVGEGYNETRIGTYMTDQSQLNSIAIGDVVPNAFATGRDNQAYLDNLSLVTVPEPGSVALLLLGAGVFGLMSRRKKA